MEVCLRILVVDDSMFMRSCLRKIIEECGHEVCGEACDGEDALQAYSTLRPDLVTMDITMPVMDGIEALKKIKALDKDARITMVSAMGRSDLVMSAIMNGAMDFLVKPFVLDIVKRSLLKWESMI